MTALTARTSDAAQIPMPPAELQGVDAGFERRLIAGVRPIAEHFLASCLHQLFNTGLYDELVASGERTVTDLAAELDFDEDRLQALLSFLAVEDVVLLEDGRVALTSHGLGFGEFRSWYTLLVGGYSRTLDQLGEGLLKGASPCSRNGRYVGLGSCDMAAFDGLPMTKSLLATGSVAPREILDLGCGNGRYLVDLCRQLPGSIAWGAEPDLGGFSEAQSLIRDADMTDRVKLANSSAAGFLASPPADCDPDLIVFGYVLQEVLGQSGEDAVVKLLQSTVERFPQINIVVIEVANEVANPAVMQHGVARNFWNTYYLVHPFTQQRLESREYWDAVFARAGLTEQSRVTTPAQVDTSGVEIGYLLRGPQFNSSAELGQT